MSRLFDISQDFETLFDQFDSISEYEFELNEKVNRSMMTEML